MSAAMTDHKFIDEAMVHEYCIYQSVWDAAITDHKFNVEAMVHEYCIYQSV